MNPDPTIATAVFDQLLTFVLMVSGSIWAGGYVAIVVVTRIVRRRFAPADQIAFFQDLGRIRGSTAALALVAAIAAGVIMLVRAGWTDTATVAAATALGLVLATIAGVRQARMMTGRRRAALADPMNEQLAAAVRRSAIRAALLRGLIGALTLILIGLGSTIAS